MRLLLVITLVVYCLCANAQDKEKDDKNKRFVNKGLLSAQGNIAFGTMPGFTGTNMYIHGDLEYYVRQNVSIRSESYYFLGTQKGDARFAMNHSNFTGAMFHLKTSNSFDSYFGIQPGIVLSKINRQALDVSYASDASVYAMRLNPAVGISGGFNYYGLKFFHLFIHAKYVIGKHVSDAPAVSLNELKFTFGLGWNIWLIKKEKRGEGK